MQWCNCQNMVVQLSEYGGAIVRIMWGTALFTCTPPLLFDNEGCDVWPPHCSLQCALRVRVRVLLGLKPI